MRFSQAKAGLGIAALAMLLAFGTTASAAPISKCNAAKKKCIGKYIAAVMGCHAKAEGKSLPVDPVCLSKATAKITGAGKGCFDKADVKNDGCSQTGDAASQLGTADAFILDAVNDIDPGYPTPHTNKCDAAEKKCVGKKAAGLMGCKAKENKDGIGDPACEPKIQGKFTNVDNKGCFDKAVVKNDGPCDGATAAAIETKTDNWAAASALALDTASVVPTPTPTSTPGGPTCGNGVLNAGEDCDPAGGPATSCQGASNTGAGFTCSPTCQCACPTTVTFAGDATNVATVLDTGWTGISHRAPAISNSEVTVALSGCTGSSRPCGVCNVLGPIANPNAGAGQIDNRRCTNDTSIHCTTNAPCTGGGGTCQFFFGSALPLAAGGVTTCVVNQFNGAVTGTANVETGDAANVANLTSRVYNGLAIDNPCARCIGDATINDGLQGGLCSGGTRNGLGCDANGTVPGRPDFGQTSLDCPLAAGALIATLPINLTNATSAVTKTVSALSPGCSGAPGEKCLCGTCNNLNQEPCEANADCPDPAGPTGPICNGNRCLGGTNAGAPCVNVSECPGGGQCNKPGEPTKPSACLDNTATAGVLDCSDTAPVDGEGECTSGPVTNTCSVASGHGQRGCSVDADCAPGGPGSCESTNRRCFLTGGFTGPAQGTDTLIAQGMADTPMGDVSNPTLGSVFCVGPTGAAAVNNVAGLPGPGRVTIKGQAVGKP